MSDSVKDGYCRQIINFIRAGWWRNWVTVNPSGADVYVPDKLWQMEQEQRAKELAEDKAAGLKIDFTKRPTWMTN